MLATINDSKEYLNESLCTLSFAMRCKGLVIKPIATIDLPNLSDEDQKSNIGISENSKKTNPSNFKFYFNYNS